MQASRNKGFIYSIHVVMIHIHVNRIQTMQKSFSLMPQPPSCPFLFPLRKPISAVSFLCAFFKRELMHINTSFKSANGSI